MKEKVETLLKNMEILIETMLRSIQKAFDIIKAEDAETAITVHTIRTWCKQGKIKCLTAGNKVLVDMQSLLDYIAIKEEK